MRFRTEPFWIVVACTGLAAVVLSAHAEAGDPRTAEAEAVLERFLETSCRVGERGSLVDGLGEYRDLLEPRLLELLLHGPDPQMLDETQRSLEQAWARREAFLASYPELGLDPEDAQIAAGVSRESYLERGHRHRREAYLERAVVGLAAIGSAEAIETLVAWSAQAEPRLGRLVEQALERYRGIRRRLQRGEPAVREGLAPAGRARAGAAR